MKLVRTLLIVVAFSGVLLAQRNTVLVRPKPMDDVLLNPNMGITTFNRFNGQATNPPLEWSELGPVEKLPQAATKPDFPDTTIAYLRWYWTALEPEHGKYRWDILDLALEGVRHPLQARGREPERFGLGVREGGGLRGGSLPGGGLRVHGLSRCLLVACEGRKFGAEAVTWIGFLMPGAALHPCNRGMAYA